MLALDSYNWFSISACRNLNVVATTSYSNTPVLSYFKVSRWNHDFTAIQQTMPDTIAD